MSYTLSIEDANGNVYSFPSAFCITAERFDFNNNYLKRGYAPGSINIADKMPNSRVITISGTLQADTAAAFETAYHALKLACIKGGKLRKVGDTVNRYIEVEISAADPGFEMGQQLREDISKDFTAKDVFWFDETETEDENILTGNDDFTIDITGSEYILYPIIEIEADQGADLPSVLIKNNNDGGAGFTYNNSLFVQGDILVIDCDMGTVKINSNDAIEFFSGSFLRLQLNSNEIVYEGNAATVRIKYRKVYY